MVLKSPYHQELQTNGRESRMNYERQDTSLNEKVEKLRKLLPFSPE